MEHISIEHWLKGPRGALSWNCILFCLCLLSFSCDENGHGTWITVTHDGKWNLASGDKSTALAVHIWTQCESKFRPWNWYHRCHVPCTFKEDGSDLGWKNLCQWVNHPHFECHLPQFYPWYLRLLQIHISMSGFSSESVWLESKEVECRLPWLLFLHMASHKAYNEHLGGAVPVGYSNHSHNVFSGPVPEQRVRIP